MTGSRRLEALPLAALLLLSLPLLPGGAGRPPAGGPAPRAEPGAARPPLDAPPRRRRRRGPLPDWAARSWLFRRHVETPLALSNAHVVDVQAGGIRRDVTIVIAGDVIRSVSPEPPPEGATVVDLEGRYVIPGLIDLHAHVIPAHPAFPAAPPPREALARWLDAGVTTIRCLPLTTETALTWSAAVNAGRLTGPTIVPASALLEREPQRSSFGFGDADTAARRVRKEALLGARWIKVYNRMDSESLRAIVAAARAQGLKVCGHAADVPPHAASAIGLDSVEHITGIPRSCRPAGAPPLSGPLFEQVAAGWGEVEPQRALALMRTFRDNGTAWVPTLVVTEQVARSGRHDGRLAIAPESTGRLLDAVRRGAQLAVAAHRLGVAVGLGTDAPVDGVATGDAVHRELELLVELGGATPLEALRIATIASAGILGHEALLGSVEPGKLAHLAVLDRNPLEDVSNTRAVHLVVHDGRLHEPATRARDDGPG